MSVNLISLINGMAVSLVAVSTYLIVFGLLAKSDTTVKLKSPFPVYSDTDLDAIPPINKEGTAQLIALVKKFKNFRNSFSDMAGSLGEPHFSIYSPVELTGTPVANPTILTVSAINLIVVAIIFLSIMLIAGSRLKIGDTGMMQKEYECGVDLLTPTAENRVQITALRIAVLFLIFEIEAVLLFLILPNITIFSTVGLLIILFIFFIFQLTLFLEARGGTLTHRR